MNYPLLVTLNQGMKTDVRSRILELVAQSNASDHELVSELSDVELTKMVNLAAYYLAKASERVYASEPTFDNGYNLTALVDGMELLMKNPAILNYTQAVVILVIALLTEEIDREAI